ncbi:hypothetical protein B0H66DRAFT_614971 [Apodospora peruviana]|uniref:Uncharacterized protein n=1 Tax=Apodospora peruviana TaxID=516989 RepID=A0AAE0M9Z8_9PEZI|nr:hypothetical protein B0H66DRAFT_614971 [Apodospora peruviana]
MASGLGWNTFELSLVCEVHVDDIETARLAVTSLLNLSRLRDCHVRFCKTPDPRIQLLAQDTVLRARGIPAAHSPSATVQTALPASTEQDGSLQHRLVSLPRELHLRIFGYTDLITPPKEVTWSRGHSAYVALHRKPEPHPAYGAGGRFYCDRSCQVDYCWRRKPNAKGKDSGFATGCFCRVWHSAFSSRCNCWSSSQSLFPICRTLLEDARFIFFSGNLFVVHDHKCQTPFDVPEGGPYLPEQFVASYLLREIVPRHCLYHLRFLEIVFHPYRAQTWP